MLTRDDLHRQQSVIAIMHEMASDLHEMQRWGVNNIRDEHLRRLHDDVVIAYHLARQVEETMLLKPSFWTRLRWALTG